MAAAEYYNPGGQQANLAPPQPAQPFQANPHPPYPLSDAPPPYSEFPQPRPHSQPPPQQRPPQPNDAYRPPPPNGFPQHPPEKGSRPPPPIQNMYRPSDFGGPYTPQANQQYGQYQQPQGYFPLAGTPAMQQVYGNGNGNPGGRRTSSTPVVRPPRSPRRDESRSRSRSRSGGTHRKHHHNRPQVQRKKSSGVNTFLGAGGGAIIGDAIFPGLGTLGGAILGGLGGHEYGKRDRRPHSNPASTRGRSYSNDSDYYQDDYRRGRK